jgi:VanZ family protein
MGRGSERGVGSHVGTGSDGGARPGGGVAGPAPWLVRYGWAVWATVVFVAAVVPVGWVFGFAPNSAWSWMSGLGHFAEFGIFAALVAVAWDRRHEWRRALLVGVTAGVGYGLLVEIVQYPLPYRSADPRDFALDVCGVAAAALLLSWARRARVRRTGRRG